jgi:cytochrome P450
MTEISFTAEIGDNSILVALAVGGALLLASFIFQKKRESTSHDDSPWPKVPGALPIIGNLIPGGMENLNNTLIHWAKKYGTADSTNIINGIYECNIFGSRTIIIYNQEKLSIIDKYRTTSQIQRMEGIRDAAGSVGANGLFNAIGLSWKRDKRMIGPFLNRQHIDDYVPSITLVATRLCKKWEEELLMAKHNDDDIPYITINEDLLCTTMDIISLISCGHDLNSIEKKGKEEEAVVQLDEDLRDVFHLVTLRSLVPFSFWNIPFIGQYMDGGGWKVHRVKRTLMKIVNDTKHSLLAKTSRSSEGVTSKSADDGSRSSSSSSAKKKLSFLRKLLIQHRQEDDEKKSHLDIDRLFGNLLTLFIAGTDTTTNTLCVCLYMLAADKVLQDKIASESLALFQNTLNSDAPNNNGADGKKKAKSSQHMYEQCPRTMSLIYEVIRYYGPAPILFLENSKPIDLIGTTLPAKTQFMILNGYAMRCNSENDGEKCTPRGYKDSSPSIFDAERYLMFGSPSEVRGNDYEVSSATTTTLHPTTPKTGFRGFGSSIRVCPGRQLA